MKLNKFKFNMSYKRLCSPVKPAIHVDLNKNHTFLVASPLHLKIKMALYSVCMFLFCLSFFFLFVFLTNCKNTPKPINLSNQQGLTVSKIS